MHPPRKARHSPRRTVLTTLLAGIVCFFLLLGLGRRSKVEDPSNPNNSEWSIDQARLAIHDTRHLICNPYDQPGYLNWVEGSRTAKWITYPSLESPCPSAPDYFALVSEALQDLGTGTGTGEEGLMAEERKQKAIERTQFLRNKSILLLGDSVDRNALVQLNELLRAKAWVSDYHNASFTGVPEGWDIRGVPHILEKKELNLHVYSGFFYGMDDVDEFRWQVDWRPPGKVETRIEELFAPFMNQTRTPPDFIQLHSGMWDLALWGRQDTKDDVSTNTVLTEERVKWWTKRMKAVVASVREQWPGVPIWFRLSHRVALSPTESSDDYARGTGNHKVQNYFTDLRTHQFRELQRAVARELCLPVFDFGYIWEGFQSYQEKVHPLMYPGSLAYNLPLLHHVWMESQGRENWLDKPCQGNYLP